MAIDEIIEEINKLSVLELVELKDKLQEQWGGRGRGAHDGGGTWGWRCRGCCC